MRIYVKSNNQPTIELKINESSTIKKLKEMIETITSIPISEQVLLKNLKTELSNDEIVSHTLIKPLSCLTLKHSLPPRSSSLNAPMTATIANLRRFSIDVCSKNDPFEVFFQKCRESDFNYIAKKLEESPELGKIYSSEGWTCLHYAGFIGNADLVQLILSYDVDVNQLTMDKKWSTLHLVAIQGHTQALRALLSQKDIIVDLEVEENCTALHCACLNGNADAVELLLKAKANCTIENNLMQLPIDLAASREIKEILGKYMGKSEDFPEFYEGPLNLSRALIDFKGWAVLRPAEGVLFLYKNQKALASKKKPEKRFDIKEMKEIRRCKPPFLHKDWFYFHMVSAVTGDKHVFYSEFEEIANFWVKNLFTSLLYRQSHSKKSENEEIMLLDFPSTPDIDFFSFEILKQIGAGSFSVVHLVRKKDTNEIFAMKSMSKQFLIQKNYLKNAITECRVLSIVNCPFIVRLHFCFATPRSLYMVLEHCSSGSLAALLKKFVSLPESLSVIYIAELVVAIEYIHDMNIIYRDLKPENILISHNWHIKLADFGLVKENFDGSALSRTFCGTPAYLSPEMLSRKGVNKMVDIYAIGCILFELVTGFPPFYSDNMAKMLRRIEKGNIKFPEVINPVIKDLIGQMMNKDPQARPTFSCIKAHRFFEGIKWEELGNGVLPVISDEILNDLQNLASRASV